MLQLTAAKGTLTKDLTSATCLVDGEKVRWGDFQRTERFKRWTARGKSKESYPFGEWFEPATHTFPVVSKDPVSEIDAVLTEGGTLTASDGTTTRTAYIVNVERSEPDYREGYAFVTYAVTTRMWCAPRRIPDHSVYEYNAALATGTCFGATIITGVKGDAPALTDHRMTSVSPTNLMALAVVPEPADGFSPLLDQSGTSSASAIGGSALSAAAGTSGYVNVAPVSFDPSLFGPDGLVLLRAKLSASVASSFYVESTCAGSGSLSGTQAAKAADPIAGHSDGTYTSIPFGPFPIPAADMVYGRESTISYGDEVLRASQTSSTTVVGPLTGPLNLGTITVPADGQNAHVQVEAKSSTSSSDSRNPNRINITFTETTTGAVLSGRITHAQSMTSYAYLDVLNPSTGMILTLPAGTYSVSIVTYVGAGWTFHLTSAQSNYKLYQQPRRIVGTGLNVWAKAASAANALVDALCVLPVACGWAMVQRSAGANCGIMVDCTDDDPQASGVVYDYKFDGTTEGTGVALDCTGLTPQPRITPGTCAVVLASGATDTGSAPGGQRYIPGIIERFVRPFGDN